MINGIFGLLFGGMAQQANPQGLPFSFPPQPVEPQRDPSVLEPKKAENEATPQNMTPVSEDTPVDFQYKKEVMYDFHDFCESLGIPLEMRNSLLSNMNENISTMNPIHKQLLVNQLTGAATQNAVQNVATNV